jgi:hypothetical protein
MTILNHLAQAAAVILLIYLLVALVIFAGIAGGLAFGLRWSRRKSGWAFEKVNGQLPTARKYVHQGTDYAAKPFILGGGLAARARVTAEGVRRRVQATRTAPAADLSRPRAETEVTEVVPVVTEETPAVPAAAEVTPRL